MDPSTGGGKPHLPAPTLWPIGFAVGIVCLLVGLVVSWVAVAVGAAIAAVFGWLWLRDRGGSLPAPPAPEGPEQPIGPPVPAHLGPAAMPEPAPGERFPRSRFLEGATLGLGAVIGGVVTVPPLGLLVAPALLPSDKDKIDLGPLSEFPEGQFIIVTFVSDPDAGEVSRRTAYVRYNGLLDGQPSFTILSNRCAHLGCPVQPGGPTEDDKTTTKKDDQGYEILVKRPTTPANFTCPCHGGSYDTEGNRIAGPPVRALDRYSYSIKDGRVILGEPYSVSHVEDTGKNARIQKYSLKAPGQHVDGWEAWLWPIPELR